MSNVESIPWLSQANYVGQGFDILGTYNIPDSLVLPLLDPLKVDKIEFNFLGKDYYVPAYIIPAEDTLGVYNEYTADSREDIQNSFAVDAGVSASYGAFSGHVEASYGREFAQSSEFFYSYRNFFSRLATLSINPDEAINALSDNFKQAVDKLPNNVTPETIKQFVDFFDEFGIYYTSRVSLGASLQYYVATSKISQLEKVQIGEQVKIEYKALTFGGGISEETKSTKEWKSYSSNRHVNIAAYGGDPSLVAKLGNVDPSNPSARTVELYDSWADSIVTAPGIADFRLGGIWELVSDENKSKAIHKAFSSLQTSMRPRLYIGASSEKGEKPVIILGDPIEPKVPAKHPIGYQLVVLDRSNISASGVLFNSYYGVPADAWYDQYEVMYDRIMNDIKSHSFNTLRHVLILVSYGMSRNAPPNSGIYPLLMSSGGGSKLLNWVNGADPGSSMNRQPAIYILVGIPQLGPGTGVENFISGWDKHSYIVQEVYFYAQSGSDLYTLSAGPSSQQAQTVSPYQGSVVSMNGSDISRRYLVKGKSGAFVKEIEV